MSMKIQKAILVLLALAMIFSIIPSLVFAAELDTKQRSATACDTTTTIDLYTQVYEEIVAYNAYFGLTYGMSDDELADAYIKATENPTIWAENILAAAETLSESELEHLATEDEVIIFEHFYSYVITVNTPALIATTVNPIEGISVTDSVGTGSVSGSTVTITATGGRLSRTSNTVTITNISGGTATLSFEYAVTGNYNSYTTPNGSASGTYEGVVSNNASVTIVFESQALKRTATLTLSNFELVAAAETSSITINYDSSLGSVTAAGSSVSTGGTLEGINSTDGIALNATANSGTTFHGWINATTGLIESSEASFTYKPVSDVTLTPVFTSSSSTAWFLVNNTHLFNNLNDAAGMIGATKVVLLNSGTLPALTDNPSTTDVDESLYVIPAGVTLLIPYDSSYTLCTTTPTSNGTTYVTPSVFRKMTMAEGAKIVVNGAISVSAKCKSGTGAVTDTGSPVGPCGFIDMASGSSITINSGAYLYCWGYITGAGSVIAKSGSTVYENFQFQDWRGGDVTTGIGKNKGYPLPISQFYIQNVEVPLTYEYGAKGYGFASVTVTLLGEQNASILLFGNTDSALFKISSGSLTKSYDGSTDRTLFSVDGTLTIGSTDINLGIYRVTTSNYVLGLNHAFDVLVKDGSSVTIGADMALFPSSTITIEENATVTLGSGVNFYIYDADQWGNYIGAYNVKFIPITYAPGKSHTRTEAELVDARIIVNGTLDASAGFLYTTKNGANICSEGGGTVQLNPGTATVTYQLTQADPLVYPEIPITPAKLKNSDGSFTLTGNCATSNTYNYVDGFWRCGTHTWGDWATGACSVCDEKAIRYDAINLSIEGEILLNLKYFIHDDAIKAGIKATVTEEGNAIIGPDGNTWTETISDSFKDNDDVRYVISQGIAAGEMTGDVTVAFKIDDVTVPIFDKDDLTADPVDSMTKTVTDFANIVLATEDPSRKALEELKEMCRKAVTFGGYAQIFYGTDKENPAYNILGNTAPSVSGADEPLKNVTQTTREGNNGVTATTQKLNLDSKIYIRTYFTLPENKTAADYTFTVKGPDNNGTGTLTKDGDNDRYYVDIVNVPPAYWNDTYTIVITDTTMAETENRTYTVTTSVLAWCARCVASSTASNAQKNMARAMYFYNVAADKYFTAKNAT